MICPLTHIRTRVKPDSLRDAALGDGMAYDPLEPMLP